MSTPPQTTGEMSIAVDPERELIYLRFHHEHSSYVIELTAEGAREGAFSLLRAVRDLEAAERAAARAAGVVQ